MKEPKIYKEWNKFINCPLYKEHFLNNNDKWDLTLSKVKEFINKKKRAPTNNSKNENEKILASWIGTQRKNYPKKAKIMSDESICVKWDEFINDPKYKDDLYDNRFRTYLY